MKLRVTVTPSVPQTWEESLHPHRRCVWIGKTTRRMLFGVQAYWGPMPNSVEQYRRWSSQNCEALLHSPSRLEERSGCRASAGILAHQVAQRNGVHQFRYTLNDVVFRRFSQLSPSRVEKRIGSRALVSILAHQIAGQKGADISPHERGEIVRGLTPSS